MSLLDQLSDETLWNTFYEYKTSLICTAQAEKELRCFIGQKQYLRPVRDIQAGTPFPLPKKTVISKMSTQKKRIVYTYPYEENMVLKLLTYLLLRKYNHLFSKNLYSFRPQKTAKDAIRYLTAVHRKNPSFAYKADISNYFNSVPVEPLLADLKAIMADDEPLYAFLRDLLSEPRVIENGQIITESKGIMAGTPLAAFFANVFLRKMDEHFLGIPYARYSDDMILFAPDRAAAEAHAAWIRSYLSDYGLSVNPQKEFFYAPDDQWTFLGFSCRHGIIDIAPSSVRKIKQKMRRKTRALLRWQKRNGIDSVKSARAFIRIFNQKLLESSSDHTLSWKLWFFPLISTDESLQEIDHYAQECLRHLISGTHTKARFNVRYDQLKALGYRTLVHEYYAGRQPAPSESQPVCTGAS